MRSRKFVKIILYILLPDPEGDEQDAALLEESDDDETEDSWGRVRH